MGVTISEITVADPPEAWAAAGFDVDADGCSQVGGVRLRFVGRDHGKRILGWSLCGARAGSLDGGSITGLTTSAVEAPAEPATVSHTNGALYIDHVVILAPDLQKTVAAFEDIGLSSRGERTTDTYGAPMTQVFFRTGEVILEVIGSPETPGEGDAGFFGLAFTVADLDATKALLGDQLGDLKDAVQPGRQIATLRHRDLGMSVATALMSPEPAPG
jgi:catechol 2,3-dioxygenase-like lactoylglutathione lyase family enzyme